MKITLSILGAVIIAAAIYGAYLYPKSVSSFGSAVGTTFNTAKIASVNMTPTTSAATSTSILNTDASARWVKSVDTFCTGVGTSYTFPDTQVGLASFKLTVATTSTAAQSNSTNFAGNVTLATSTPWEQSASSTISSATSVNTDLYYWPSATYLTFTFNATNTAACTISASYAAS